MRRGSGKPPTRSEEALVGTRVCTTGSSSVTFESWRKFSLNGDGTPMTRTGWIRVILTACEPLVRTKHMLELFCQSWARHREINFPDTLLYRIASSYSVRPNNRTTPGTGLALQRRRLRSRCPHRCRPPHRRRRRTGSQADGRIREHRNK